MEYISIRPTWEKRQSSAIQIPWDYCRLQATGKWFCWLGPHRRSVRLTWNADLWALWIWACGTSFICLARVSLLGALNFTSLNLALWNEFYLLSRGIFVRNSDFYLFESGPVELSFIFLLSRGVFGRNSDFYFFESGPVEWVLFCLAGVSLLEANTFITIINTMRSPRPVSINYHFCLYERYYTVCKRNNFLQFSKPSTRKTYFKMPFQPIHAHGYAHINVFSANTHTWLCTNLMPSQPINTHGHKQF